MRDESPKTCRGGRTGINCECESDQLGLFLREAMKGACDKAVLITRELHEIML